MSEDIVERLTKERDEAFGEIQTLTLEGYNSKARAEHAEAALQSAQDDTKRLDALLNKSWDLRCFSMSDDDIGWQVIGHWMADPQERIIAEVFKDDPRAAIDTALASLTKEEKKSGDDEETCMACNIVFAPDDMVLPDASGDYIHVKCCGPEREGYTLNEELLKDGDPIPTGFRWGDHHAIAASLTKEG